MFFVLFFPPRGLSNKLSTMIIGHTSIFDCQPYYGRGIVLADPEMILNF
jgi:hypothetical protein